MHTQILTGNLESMAVHLSAPILKLSQERQIDHSANIELLFVVSSTNMNRYDFIVNNNWRAAVAWECANPIAYFVLGSVDFYDFILEGKSILAQVDSVLYRGIVLLILRKAKELHIVLLVVCQ